MATPVLHRAARKARHNLHRIRVAGQVTMLMGPIGALRIGVVHAVALLLSRVGVRREYPAVSVKVRGVDHPLLFRPATSDLGIFNQIFVGREYAPLDVMETPRLVVDAGANVGYSSAYFLSRFPTVQIIALEPDPGNAELCRRNLAPYGDRARVLVRAVWPHTDTLRSCTTAIWEIEANAASR